MKSKLLFGLAAFTLSCANAHATPVTRKPISAQVHRKPLAAQVHHASTAAPKSFLNKVYLRAGVGLISYGKFKEVENSYLKRAPKSALMYHVGVGYNFTEAIRADLSLYLGSVKYKAENLPLRNLKQKIKTTAVMLNGYYDIHVHKIFVPYVTSGIGVGRNQVGALSNSRSTGSVRNWFGKSRTGVVWSVGAGVKINLGKGYAVDFGYRYMDLGKISIKDTNRRIKGSGSQNIKGHQGLMSLIYQF